jgi:signal transduction histidine kinase
VRSRTCDPEQAWCAGLLAPLGWLGVCAVAPTRVAACWSDPAHAHSPLETQERYWHADQGALARRLASGWDLPDWLAGVAGWLDLPVVHARRFNAPPALFSLVRLAVYLAREHGLEFGLVIAPTLAEDEATAGIRVSGLRAADLLAGTLPAAGFAWDDPYPRPLLRELLEVAIDNRLSRQTAVVVRLEREADELHAALREQVRTESERLQSARLLALAELAAGAGHEINNPLAVISGQAQYLLAHEANFFGNDTEGVTRKALGAIIAQTKRIHGIVRDLMQFARPAQPRPTWCDLPTLLGEVAASLGDLAGQKRVRVEVHTLVQRLGVRIDVEQVRTALGCLLRNAIEAAPADGWARIGLAEPRGETIDIFVEDSGPGVSPEQRLHLFDPFYSGRSAGRGRGLGLPVAWRLARQQGGDLRHEVGQAGVPTRFVLVLPRPPAEPRDEQQAA